MLCTMDFRWSEETFPIPRLVEKVDFPQILKLVKKAAATPTTSSSDNHKFNNNNDDDNVISSSASSRTGKTDNNSVLQDGDVLKLHGIRTFKRVIIAGAGGCQSSCEQVATEYGYLSPPGSTSIYKQFSVPANYSMPLQILPFRDLNHIYITAGDLVKEQPRPGAVIVNKTISIPEKHCVIKEGDVLAITSVDKRCTSTGVVDFLICKHNDKAVGLPMSCVGNFTALQDETLFTLNDLVTKHVDIGFPQKIRFQQVQTASDNNKMYWQTLARGGEQHIVPGAEYVAENIIKQQYLVCTRCIDNINGLSNTQVFYIPTNCSLISEMKVRLPLFPDAKSSTQVLNNRFCPNLSMRDIMDVSPIELVGQSSVSVRNLSEIFYDSPQLPPRKDIYLPDSLSLTSAQSSRCLDQREGNYANVKVLHAGRMNVSESNLTRLGGELKDRMQSVRSSEQMFTAEEQPLLGDGDSTQLTRQHKRGQSKTPVMQRKGMSTPCTPENRRKKGESPTWTEKISISLENLKRTFRKTGSEERERSRIGDGSHLADSFENLSMSNPDESPDSTLGSAHATTYVNMNLVAGQLEGPAGRAKRTQPPPSTCTQIRELWTPPCSPDYRDHTTPLDSFRFNQPQFNSTNPVVRPAANVQFVPIDGGNPLQQSPAKPTSASNILNEPNLRHSDHKRRSKSPRAAPRQAKDAPVIRHYENLDNLCPPTAKCAADEQSTSSPRRCSGYSSSGSRGSSENDLVHYQLETIKSVEMIPEDLTTLSVPGLADCLHLLELPNVAHKFKQNQIDGQFFMIMTEHMFRDDTFNFSQFELLKLRELRDGWRPRL